MANGPQLEQLNVFAREVQLPSDPIGIHLVLEVSRPGTPAETPDYRSPSTVCGQAGYEETHRITKSACDACAAGFQRAIVPAKMAARATLSIRDGARATNGHAKIVRRAR